MATPLALGIQMSPRAAETLLTGALPNRPEKKRQMMTDWAFLLTAVPMLNRPKPTNAGSW